MSPADCPDGSGPLGLPDLSRTLPDVRSAGEAVVAWALAQWEQGIRDRPEDYDRITPYLRAVGDARDYPARSKGRDYQWCGAFAGAAWRSVGLHPEIARALWPSTYRLALFGQYRTDRNIWPSDRVALPGGERLSLRDLHAGAPRYCEIVPPGARPRLPLRPGDVCCVGSVDGPWWGLHVVIAERVEGAHVHTIEGNGVGELGAGLGRGEGVVRNARPLDTVRLHLRPSPWDLVTDPAYI